MDGASATYATPGQGKLARHLQWVAYIPPYYSQDGNFCLLIPVGNGAGWETLGRYGKWTKTIFQKIDLLSSRYCLEPLLEKM